MTTTHTFFKNKIFFLYHVFTHTAFPLSNFIVVLPWYSKCGARRRKYSTPVKLKEWSASNWRLVNITQSFFACSVFSYFHLSFSSLVRATLELCQTVHQEALWKGHWTTPWDHWDRMDTSCLPWFNENISHFVLGWCQSNCGLKG